MNIAVIGIGYWGPNLVRNCLENRSIDKVYAVDLDQSRLDNINSKYRSVIVNQDYESILKDDNIAGVLIATPVSFHYDLAKKAILAGKHVVVEKPMASSHREASELVELSEKMGVVLMVDHTFIYTPAVQKIKEIVSSGNLGDLYYFDSVRVNLGMFQHDVNVIWDLAPHDFSIMDYLIDIIPMSVTAMGEAHIKDEMENIAYVHVNFENGFIAHFHLNWLSPVKIRKIIIAGDKKMVTYDDLESTEKIRVFDSGVTLMNKGDIYKSLVQYRTGDMYAPIIDNTEALKIMVNHFVESVQNKTRPITDGISGMKVVRLLEATSESIRECGKTIRL